MSCARGIEDVDDRRGVERAAVPGMECTVRSEGDGKGCMCGVVVRRSAGSGSREVRCEGEGTIQRRRWWLAWIDTSLRDLIAAIKLPKAEHQTRTRLPRVYSISVSAPPRRIRHFAEVEK